MTIPNKQGISLDIAFKKRGQLPSDTKRVIIPNDSKMFAQADTEKRIAHYLTSDTKWEAIHKVIKEEVETRFEFLNLNRPYHENFGGLDLDGSNSDK